MVTSPSHDIQFVNQASERILGRPATEILGKNAQELQRIDSQKKDQIENLNKQYVRKSKVRETCIVGGARVGIQNYRINFISNSLKEWETTLINRKKSAEYLHFWNKMATVESHKGLVITRIPKKYLRKNV